MLLRARYASYDTARYATRYDADGAISYGALILLLFHAIFITRYAMLPLMFRRHFVFFFSLSHCALIDATPIAVIFAAAAFAAVAMLRLPSLRCCALLILRAIITYADDATQATYYAAVTLSATPLRYAMRRFLSLCCHDSYADYDIADEHAMARHMSHIHRHCHNTAPLIDATLRWRSSPVLRFDDYFAAEAGAGISFSCRHALMPAAMLLIFLMLPFITLYAATMPFLLLRCFRQPFSLTRHAFAADAAAYLFFAADIAVTIIAYAFRFLLRRYVIAAASVSFRCLALLFAASVIFAFAATLMPFADAAAADADDAARCRCPYIELICCQHCRR